MPAGLIEVLLGLIRQATRAVPAVRYALGVVGIAAAAALVFGVLGRDAKVAIFAPLGLLVLMVLLLLFAKLAAQTDIPSLRAALLVLIWMPLILAFGALILLGSSVFFGKPLDLRHWLTGQITTASPTPTPLIRQDVQQLPALIKARQHITLRPDTPDRKVSVTRSIHIEQEGTLEIPAGVSLEFDRDVGIICEGTLIARGTADHRIRFGAVDPRTPWGNIVLYSPRGAESSFAYCDFDHGGGAAYFEPDVLRSQDESGFKPTGGTPRIGGALIVFSVGNLRVDQCRFSSCRAAKAGAIYLRSTQKASIVGCEFIGNSVSSATNRAGGGAIFAQNSVFSLVDCKFTANRALDKHSCGGAIYLGFRAGCTISRAVFTRNQATNAGGAIYAINLIATRPGGREALRISAEFDNAEFLGNTAGRGGGAIFIDQGFSCQLDGVRFEGNAIGTQEVPIGSRATPEELLNGAAVMVNSDAVDNRSQLRFGDEVCLLKNNVVFMTEGQRSAHTTPIVALFTGRNVEAGSHDSFEEPIIVNESLLPSNCFREQRTERTINAAVIHHISAVKWFAQDFQSKLTATPEVKEAVENLAPTKETLHEWKYRWEACKTILQTYRISSHYLIARDGKIIRLVHENDVAFHAGKARMPPPDRRDNVDQFSVGVELIAANSEDDETVARGDTKPYTDEQYQALGRLLAVMFWRCATSALPSAWSLVGHNEIATKEVRGVEDAKNDPGPAFLWARFRDDQKRLRLD
jgi:predicted outer membrane repeat protein